MRLYVKKFLAGGCVLILLWMLLTYFFTFRVPIMSPIGNSLVEMEGKLDILKQKMDSQFQESQDLLDKIKRLDKKPVAMGLVKEKKQEEEEYKEADYEQGKFNYVK